MIKSISIVGMGVLGRNLYEYFTINEEYCDVDVSGYDIDKSKSMDSWKSVEEADLVFICVSTPYSEFTGFDISHVENAISRIKSHKIIVIRSTITPGSTEYLQEAYSRHKILFSPEFLREASAWEDTVNPHTTIVGYTLQSKPFAPMVLKLLPRGKVKGIVKAKEAEMIKYARNVFLATKVVFANRIYDICQKNDVDYDVVKEGLETDPRIGASHLKVFHNGGRGAGGVCLPKDLASFCDYSNDLFFDTVRIMNDNYLNDSGKSRGRQFYGKKETMFS